MPQKKERTLLKMDKMMENLNNIMNTLNNIIDKTNNIELDIKDIKDKLDGVERMEVEPIISIEKI